jgi:hypothetical protein
LIELLLVVVVVAIFAALLLPAGHGPGSGFLAICLVNQKQIATDFNIWQNDSGKFPWQVSVTNIGTMEYAERGYAAPNFQVLSNFFNNNPAVFTCPTDKGKTVATNFAQFNNQNVSYFIGFDPGTNQPTSILTGDRHLENNGKPLKPGLFVYSNGSVMNWTHELHGNVKRPIGCLSFVDSHVEAVRGERLTSVFQRQGSATNRIAVP